jgi:hypothetical protein
VAVDHFYSAPGDVKRMLLDYHGSTNYSVVDLDLIDELYRRAYQERVRGAERLRILNASRLLELTERPGGVRAVVEFLPTGERTVLGADAIICATGYRSRDPLTLLGELTEYCARRPDGTPVIDRDYRLATPANVRCGIYVQGATEHTHGLSSTLLSNTAVRADEITRSRPTSSSGGLRREQVRVEQLEPAGEGGLRAAADVIGQYLGDPRLDGVQCGGRDTGGIDLVRGVDVVGHVRVHVADVECRHVDARGGEFLADDVGLGPRGGLGRAVAAVFREVDP